MRILAIETSCDETAAAVVEDGGRVLSNVVASQTRLHRAYHGVVPELASRSHIEYILPVVAEALRLAGSDPTGAGIDAIAVTRGPGLVGALLVGVETAKALAWRWRVPLVAVHHTLGHLLSVFCELPDGRSRFLEVPPEEDFAGERLGNGAAAPQWFNPDPSGADLQVCAADPNRGAAGSPQEAAPPSSSLPSSSFILHPSSFSFPFLGLAISGGHCSLVRVDAPTRLRVLGSTLDDAPGEAYDKVAKCLGLGYPGGPEVDRRAALGNPTAFDLPRPVLHRGYDFSFSGLKTSVVRAISDAGGLARFRADEALLNDLCASFQAAVIDVLIAKAERALAGEGLRRLAFVGGVACNRGLRAAAQARLRGVHLVFPVPALCTDNAAMIGAAAAHLPALAPEEALRLDARAGWELEESLVG